MINPTEKATPDGPKSAQEAFHLWPVHEAGHVIVGSLAGYEFTRVEMAFDPMGGPIGAVTSFGPESRKQAPARMFILSTVAGIGGELAAYNDEVPNWSQHGWEDDLKFLPVFQLSRAELEAIFVFAQNTIEEHRELHNALAAHLYGGMLIKAKQLLTPVELNGLLLKYPLKPITNERFDDVFPRLANPLVSYAENHEQF
jgi:hypothetical protein